MRTFEDMRGEGLEGRDITTFKKNEVEKMILDEFYECLSFFLHFKVNETKKIKNFPRSFQFLIHKSFYD